MMAETHGMVMVVDDHEDVRDSMLLLLDVMGWRGRGYATAEAALEALLHDDGLTRYAIAFIDVSLPGMSGLELASRLRAEMVAQTRRPILVAMTGWGSADDRAQTLAAGFDEHVIKPLDVPHLEQLLGKALN
jgi:CheY-like chemotaxis protein